MPATENRSHGRSRLFRDAERLERVRIDRGRSLATLTEPGHRRASMTPLERLYGLRNWALLSGSARDRD